MNNTNLQLILFRHAKSDWASGAADDFHRPLAAKGKKAAKHMGKLLATMGQAPDFILTSSAVRTHETQRLASVSGHWGAPIGVTDDLYETSPAAVLEIIRQMPGQYRRVMLVGHEPCWSELTSLLIGGGEVRFPTAAMVRIDFDARHWSQISQGSGELNWFLPPKHLKNCC
ncbi:SixA phosphatase family protein [Solemya velum gill symbiont]|uniref:SixA phosphatase family protein n=1 Tax=Solemya velum gill symbiont TaxID=2340 RepID=UPI0009964A78|nr:histidine phosphatase family protein [Solemya velum gill symbiont]OOY98947.1 hypothetical protein BOW19_06385 [Solemya velum gill symbiont]OOZ01214.1 hypothetical protein BOW20_06045 [Solemya velum gill symbiont]OOZ03425.1 hypothetical protein BOW21_06415 [Solemya velum gill symbiont]OOZ05679.1 hypothetical protein BOW22_06380 [Solemya velum gill symbiont]OOZ07905.1 hypothetical protein BOW23_06380 [Solemya velum gill symbiont]